MLAGVSMPAPAAAGAQLVKDSTGLIGSARAVARITVEMVFIERSFKSGRRGRNDNHGWKMPAGQADRGMDSRGLSSPRWKLKKRCLRAFGPPGTEAAGEDVAIRHALSILTHD